MSKQAILITPNNEVGVVDLPDDEQQEYSLFSKLLGGMIQAVPLDQELSGITIWVNEEGKLEGLRLNQLATRVWVASYGYTDVMVGNALITGGADSQGKTKGLTESQMTRIRLMVTD